MNINASIIDQRLQSVTDAIRQRAAEELNINDADKLKSLAFVYFCVQTILDLEDSNTFDCLTEGGGDFGVDAMHISEEYDGEFTVSLFQVKYVNNLEGKTNFTENGITALINAIRFLFDPTAKLEHINQRLLAKVEEARSLIRDGYIPQVRALGCNNGIKWNASSQEAIDRSGFGDQVTWEHINHEHLIKILQASKPVKDTLQLSGKAVVEDMNFSRVLVGRISITEIAALIERHGERLLERNIRRYLGLQGNRVNEGIRDTLNSDEKKQFLLNGAQVVIAVQLYRIAEKQRKRPNPNDPACVRYASCFIAMQMGRRLLKKMNLQMKEIDHRNFEDVTQLINQNGENYFHDSVRDVQKALQVLYGSQEISLQQLSATFRRGDLIEKLQQMEIH
jgi:hypothetical protein